MSLFDTEKFSHSVNQLESRQLLPEKIINDLRSMNLTKQALKLALTNKNVASLSGREFITPIEKAWQSQYEQDAALVTGLMQYFGFSAFEIFQLVKTQTQRESIVLVGSRASHALIQSATERLLTGGTMENIS